MEDSRHVGEVGICRNVAEAEIRALRVSKPVVYDLATLIWGVVCTWCKFLMDGEVASLSRRRIDGQHHMLSRGRA